MRFTHFCVEMEDRIVLREIKKTLQSSQYDMHLSDWMIDKNLGAIEFDLTITGLARVAPECIELVEKYIDARITASTHYADRKTFRLL